MEQESGIAAAQPSNQENHSNTSAVIDKAPNVFKKPITITKDLKRSYKE
jgi:hypothetical protein